MTSEYKNGLKVHSEDDERPGGKLVYKKISQRSAKRASVGR